MRVLQLIDSLNAGGAERVAVNLANGLAEHIESSHLCATREEGLLKTNINNSVGYFFLNKTSTIDFKSISTLNRYVKHNTIDVIHAHSTSFFLATIIKVLNPKLKLIWHDHYGNSEFLNQRPKKVLGLCSRYFNHIFCVNEELVKWNIGNLKCKNVSYLQNFAEVSNSNLKETQLQGNDGKRILCLANLREQKDHFNLLNAFSLVAEKYPDWTLHCVGKDFKDEYSKAVYKLQNGLGLNTNVFFYGSLQDTDYIISQCDIGVLSSKSEGLPLALLEYGNAGLAVASTNVGDCSKVINNESLGILVEPKQHLKLYEALSMFIKNENERTAKAFNLKQYIAKHFSKTAVIKTLENVYNKTN